MSTQHPIILLHGAVGSEVSTISLRKFLADHRKVYSFNFPGHGGKDLSDGGFGIESFSKELLAFMDMKKLEQASVFGYSMGGYVALYTALHHPQRFHRILTLGTRMIWDPETAAKEIAKLNPEKILEKVPAFASQLKHEHGDPHWTELLSNTASMLSKLGEVPLLTMENLATLSIPIRICVAEHDALAGTELSKAIADILPMGEYVEIQDAHHSLEKTPLSEILHQIKSFL